MKNLYLKLFLYLISQRRNFIPILSIYFLSLPDTLANQIWIYNGIWFIASFLLEIPSGYFADYFGHKKTLILSKLFQLCSIIFYIIWNFVNTNYIFFLFTLWSVFQAIWFSLFSWTTTAFISEILKKKRWKVRFSKFIWKLRWNVSLVSIPIILFLPFLTSINIIMPFLWALIIDIIWFIWLLLLPSPKNNIKIKEKKNIIVLFKNSKKSKVLWLSISIWVIIWFFIGSGSFRGVYLESLGFPVAFIWFVMWGSRLIRFIVWQFIHKIEKIFTIKQYFFIEIFIYPLSFFAFAYFSNPYLVWFLFSIIIWYQHWRKWVMDSFILKNIKDKNYKATMLSIESQINALAWILVSCFIGFIMQYSYKLWHIVLWILLFIILLINYFYTFKREI